MKHFDPETRHLLIDAEDSIVIHDRMHPADFFMVSTGYAPEYNNGCFATVRPFTGTKRSVHPVHLQEVISDLCPRFPNLRARVKDLSVMEDVVHRMLYMYGGDDDVSTKAIINMEASIVAARALLAIINDDTTSECYPPELKQIAESENELDKADRIAIKENVEKYLFGYTDSDEDNLIPEEYTEIRDRVVSELEEIAKNPTLDEYLGNTYKEVYQKILQEKEDREAKDTVCDNTDDESDLPDDSGEWDGDHFGDEDNDLLDPPEDF